MDKIYGNAYPEMKRILRNLTDELTVIRADMTEEMADVTLVMSDIRRALGVSEEEMYKVINEKMKRTEERNG